MLTFVVMPCLNEEELIERAIQSLLRSADDDGPDPQFIIVDNGSTDATLKILARCGRLYPGLIHVEHERRRGFVPPRRRGVWRAAELAAASGVDPRDVLILQADADTIYKPGYVGAMRRAAEAVSGVIFEGATQRPPPFEADHPLYVAAERSVDAAVEWLEAADADDVIVDDKVCAYRLSDYLRWGGLFEEHTAQRDRIHAETTRMYIRATLKDGARKVRVNPAGAFPSRRRILEDPRYQFATLGFPRERSWSVVRTNGWKPVDIDAFARSILEGDEREAAFLRFAHMIALFRLLPAVLMRAAGHDAELLHQDDVMTALTLLPSRSKAQLVRRPALAIMDVLTLIDTRPEIFATPAIQSPGPTPLRATSA